MRSVLNYTVLFITARRDVFLTHMRAPRGGAPPPPLPQVGARDRRKASILRIAHLWRDGAGNPFVSGMMFLKPFQTFYREDATFYSNELVLSTINRTVPLDGALGRAWVISPELFVKGRPVGAIEEDVWVVEHQCVALPTTPMVNSVNVFHSILLLWHWSGVLMFFTLTRNVRAHLV